MTPNCMMICQPFGIGDVLFIQKIIRSYAAGGYRVVVPLLDRIGWLRDYLEPQERVEYPLIDTTTKEWTGSFENGRAFMALYSGAVHDKANPVYKAPVLYDGEQGEQFIFMALSESYERLNEKLMPAKYRFVGMEFADWVDHVPLVRNLEKERALYYDVLGLTDDARFTLLNEKSSRSILPLPVPGNVVRLAEVDGFSLIDWSLVIEKAAQIATIDTSLVLLAEILRVHKPLYMVSRYEPPSFEALDGVLKLDWSLVMRPSDLRVLPVF